jgi:hypothetical protein
MAFWLEAKARETLDLSVHLGLLSFDVSPTSLYFASFLCPELGVPNNMKERHNI